MNRWLARLGYALRRHGPVGFIWLVGYNIVYPFLPRNRSHDGQVQADSFDEIYGTDTAGTREIGTLDVVNSPVARYAGRYDPSNADWVRSQLYELKIDYTRFIFVDFGSGKGRVLLVAAGFPFKEVVGIELSRELHEVAVRNIARLPSGLPGAGATRSICGDAGSFELPHANLVCFFYNPFGAQIMREVAARLAAHHDRYGYRVIVIYVDPRHGEIFENTGKFIALFNDPLALVLTTCPLPTL